MKIIKLKIIKIIVLLFVVILATTVSCQHRNILYRENSNILDNETSELLSIPISVYIPSMSNIIDYSGWAEYFNKEFNISLSIEAQTDAVKDLLNPEIYLSAKAYTSFIADYIKEGKCNDGILLLNMYEYYQLYQVGITNLANSEKRDPIDGITYEVFRDWVGEPLNEFNFLKSINSKLLDPYTDTNGDIWGVPYEYLYPDVRVRKFQKSLMFNNKYELPKTIDEFYHLLIKVKNEVDIPYLLPTLNSNSVFAGFEDVVSAFGIYYPEDSSNFYSIQYDKELGAYIDTAFSEEMSNCIDFLVLLIDENLISGETNITSTNDNFHDGLIFSVFDEIDRNDDLTVPYITGFATADYETKCYFNPTRYVYVLGKKLDTNNNEINTFFNLLYLNEETAAKAQYGIGANNINDTYFLSIDDYKKAPKLIGTFEKQDTISYRANELSKFRNSIRVKNIDNDYYREIFPGINTLELIYSDYYIDNNKTIYENDVTYKYINTFYDMLGAHLYKKIRPSTEEFLDEYRRIMKKQPNYLDVILNLVVDY